MTKKNHDFFSNKGTREKWRGKQNERKKRVLVEIFLLLPIALYLYLNEEKNTRRKKQITVHI